MMRCTGTCVAQPVYQEIAIKFLNHFLAIAKAMTNIGETGIGLWDEKINFSTTLHFPTKSRSSSSPVHGWPIPIFAVEVIEPELLKRLPRFKEYLDWVLKNRPNLASLVSSWDEPGRGHRHLFSLCGKTGLDLFFGE